MATANNRFFLTLIIVTAVIGVITLILVIMQNIGPFVSLQEANSSQSKVEQRFNSLSLPPGITKQELTNIRRTAENLSKLIDNAGFNNDCIESKETKKALENHLTTRHLGKTPLQSDLLPGSCGDSDLFYKIIDSVTDPLVTVFLHLGVPGITYFVSLLFGP